MTTRAEIDAAIAAGREAFQRLRGRPRLGYVTPPARVAIAAKPEPVMPAPPVCMAQTPSPRQPDRSEPDRRPPAHWLAGEREEWQEHVSASGFIAPGAGRGGFWGPI